MKFSGCFKQRCTKKINCFAFDFSDTFKKIAQDQKKTVPPLLPPTLTKKNPPPKKKKKRLISMRIEWVKDYIITIFKKILKRSLFLQVKFLNFLNALFELSQIFCLTLIPERKPYNRFFIIISPKFIYIN